tara:strand:+ start:4524 stop:5066 length:543 start_codon:yes stop_codon:yes gene_type:complete
MKNPLSEQLRLHNGPDGFNDEKDRDAVRNFFSIDKSWCEFVKERFQITGPVDELRPDPLGQKKVDLGLYQNNVLLGLIEVDHYIDWNPNWPDNYRWCHALVRKVKYWQGVDLPYIACTLNMQGDKMLVSTDEMQRDFMFTKKKKPVKLNGERVNDFFLEIPLRIAKKFGSWTPEELKRVS